LELNSLRTAHLAYLGGQHSGVTRLGFEKDNQERALAFQIYAAAKNEAALLLQMLM